MSRNIIYHLPHEMRCTLANLAFAALAVAKSALAVET